MRRQHVELVRAPDNIQHQLIIVRGPVQGGLTPFQPVYNRQYWAGPYLYDWTHGSSTTMIVEKFYADHLEQGSPFLASEDPLTVESDILNRRRLYDYLLNADYVSPEKEVDHCYGAGVLVQNFGVKSTPDIHEGDSWPFFPPPPLLCTTRRNLLRTLDVDGSTLDILRAYDPQTENVCLELGPAFAGSYELTQTRDDKVVQYSVGNNERQLVVEFDPFTGEELYYRSTAFDPSKITYIGESFGEHQCKVLVHEEEWTKQNGMVISDIERTLQCFFVSPCFAPSSTSQSGLSALALACQSAISADLAACAEKHIDDDRFLVARDCVEAFQPLHINGIAYVRDLAEFRHLLGPVMRLLAKPSSPKAWASVLLMWHYGIRLTIRDSIKLARAIRAAGHVARTVREYLKYRNSLTTRYSTRREMIDLQTDNVVRFAGSTRSQGRIVARLERTPEMGAIESLLYDLDVRLTAVNSWDLLPWSFVVDWFVDVGSLCEDLDYSAYITQLAVKNFVTSRHNLLRSDDMAYKELGVSASITLCTYVRRVASYLPEPPYRLGAPSFLRHTWEGFLITLQKLGK